MTLQLRRSTDHTVNERLLTETAEALRALTRQSYDSLLLYCHICDVLRGHWPWCAVPGAMATLERLGIGLDAE